VYRCAKQRSEPGSNKRGTKTDELTLTPLELIDRIASLAPPPRTHRHRYFGVLAPNSPLRSAVTALAAPMQASMAHAVPVATGEGALGPAPPGDAIPTMSAPVQPQRAAHYLWAVLIARIYEVLPLLRPISGLSQSLQKSPPRADHRCGMTLVMRTWVRARKLTQTGIWRHNRHRTTR
jgi:hypothetical protein